MGSKELADGRNVRLAIHTVPAFGDVEDDVRALGAEAFREIFVGLEENDLACFAEGSGNRVDRLRAVPLGEFVVRITWRIFL